MMMTTTTSKKRKIKLASIAVAFLAFQSALSMTYEELALKVTTFDPGEILKYLAADKPFAGCVTDSQG